MIEHVFDCQACGDEAGRVILYAPGEAVSPDPRDPVPELTIQSRNQDAESARLIMRCWFVELAWHEFNVPRVMMAIGEGDARELYRIDDEMVPFWCPKCPASYCREHWENWPVFDESFFDEMRGRCPRGHERRMTD